MSQENNDRSGEELRDAALARVMARQSAEYTQAAYNVVSKLPQGEYIGEDFTAACEAALGPAHAPQYWGAFTNHAQTNGVIHKKTPLEVRSMKVPGSHARRSFVYLIGPGPDFIPKDQRPKKPRKKKGGAAGANAEAA